MNLAPGELTFFRDQGYLAVPGVLSAADLEPVEAEYTDLLNRAAQGLYATGRISSPFAGLGFEEQYFAVLAEYPGLYEFLSISLPLLNDGIDPDTYRCHVGPALFGLLRHPKILDLVESVIGGEILSNPIQQIRLKPPLAKVPTSVSGYSNIGRTTWHQDHGAAMDDAHNTDMLTVWIAVTDAWDDMGCLVVSPKSHIAEELTMHCPGDLAGVAAENFIPAGFIDGKPTVKLPVSKGSVVLLSKWTEHAALDNVSDRLRWSFDLRYQPVGQPTGRPAFPSFVARSRSNPATEMTDPGEYAAQWEQARVAVLTGAFSGPIFEQERWAKYAEDPLCA